MLGDDRFAVSDSEWDRRQRIIAGFEAAWKRGERPRIRDYLPDDGPARDALLVELVHADLEFRIKRGESARVEDYLRDHPELADDRSTVLGLIRAEFAFRSRREPKLTLGRYRERFADFREELGSALDEPPTAGSPTPPGRPGSESLSLLEGPLPRQFGRFELREKIGTGSSGVVYRAWDATLGREVAVKFARPEAVGSDSEIRAFLREARNAMHLRHPNIVAILDAGPIEGTTCLVRAFIAGMTLAERLRVGPIAVAESAAMMAVVAEAVDHAHRSGIYHRDLKPSNILIDGQGVPHVADFGLARRASGDSTLSAGGPAGMLIGTPAYMSPEQARGEANRVDARSDVYALGVILYELLTGVIPFRGRGRTLQVQIREAEPTPPRSINVGIPPDLERACLKAMAKDPAARYQTASAFAADLAPVPKGGRQDAGSRRADHRE